MELQILYTEGKKDRAIDTTTIDDTAVRCEYIYFRCLIGFWRIAYGWIDLLLFLSTASSAMLQGYLKADKSLSDSKKHDIELASIILTSLSAFLAALKSYSLKAVAERRATLNEIKQENLQV